MTRLEAIRAYTAGVLTSRAAYKADRLRAEGRCVGCAVPWTGSSRLCSMCQRRGKR